MTLWSANHLFIDAVREPDGTLRFLGQDLNPQNVFGGAEYEYALTIRAEDVPRIVAALGGAPGTDVLDLLTTHAEPIVRTGESAFLRRLGIEYEFWSRVGDS